MEPKICILRKKHTWLLTDLILYIYREREGGGEDIEEYTTTATGVLTSSIWPNNCKTTRAEPSSFENVIMNMILREANCSTTAQLAINAMD